MKFLTALTVTLIISVYCFGQTKRFSPSELKEDLHFLKQLIANVHVNPNSELSPQQYDELFNEIEASLTDSSDASEFMKKIKPVIAHLSDEHSQISQKPELLSSAYRNDKVYLPLTLMERNGNYSVDAVLGNRLAELKGQTISSINGIEIREIVQKCALATTGFPGQRLQTALRQFGYLYPWAADKLTTSFAIKTANGGTIDIEGTTLSAWNAFMASHNDVVACDERLSYTKMGDIGYINACSFDVKPTGKYSADSIKHKIDGMFTQIKQDGVKKLIIDVSRNEGGNSLVGDYLISYIYDKPYMDYQTDWKRSDEYLKLLRSWKFDNAAYAAEPIGKVLHFPSTKVEPTHPVNAFKGKSFIFIGHATFSSAITFATVIKDNHIAKLIGEIPLNGHPDGFGEMYYTNLPNTQVFIRFGVKEYIRPAGKQADNVLRPDIALTDEQMKNAAELVHEVNKL